MNDLNSCEILNGTYDETTNCNNMPSVIFTGLIRIITVFTVFRLLTDFVCLYNYEF